MTQNKQSWVEVAPDSDFSIYNLPYGIFKAKGRGPRAGVAIGDSILDLYAVARLGLLDDLNISSTVFQQPVLNDFIALGKPYWTSLRARLTELLSANNEELKPHSDSVLVDRITATMYLPVTVGDYTDFYSSKEHATNLGTMFRGVENALMPNWKHLPVGYHGRASSIVVSGTPVHRPKGQTMAAGADAPSFGACSLLDFELETAFIVGKNTALGESIPVAEAEDAIFGVVLFNDWSARDIQKWEYVPLGPFLGKSFASSISPWIVTIDALDPFRIENYPQDVPVLPYLKSPENKRFDVNLEVALKPKNGEEKVISRSNFKYMYWNMPQQLAHHTVNGCNVKVGDMCGSGTISGTTPDSFGSMLELTWRGENPMEMPDGTTRKFLKDHDTLIIRGYSEKDGIRVGFGEVTGEVLPAI
ncbi:MAG: fumarylacetoacetase [Chitinophagales bacterium]